MSALNSLSAQYTDSEGEDDSQSTNLLQNQPAKGSSDDHHHQQEEVKQIDEESSSNLGKSKG